MLVLTIIQGPDKGKVFELPDNEPQLLGRSSEALPIGDNTVSRRHAELTPDAGDWYLRDLGSQNGTFINGVIITDRVKLRPGDQIRIGVTLLTFGRTEPPPASPVRLLSGDRMDTSIERALASNEDSVILALDRALDSSGPGGSWAGGSHFGHATSMSSASSAGGSSGGGSPAANLRAIYRLSALVSTLPERDRLLEGVLELIFAELNPERGCVLLLEDGHVPVPAAVRFAKPKIQPKGQARSSGSAKPAGNAPPTPPSTPATPPASFDVSRTILMHAIDRGEGVLSTNAMNDPRFRKGDSVQRLSIRSAICVPIRSGDRTFGAIYIDSSAGSAGFNAEGLSLMNAIGQQTALALAVNTLMDQKLQTERLATMGETVAMLSHSIKNILQGLRGGADVVEMGLKKDDLKVARGGWPIVRRNLDRIINLTMNMLAYSRPRTLDLELVKLAPMLDECASLLAEQCRVRGVGLIVDADPDMPPVPLDVGQLHQAMMNLMTNAIEAVDPRSGVVTVRASFTPASGQESKARAGQPSRGEVHIDVIDNGPGIPPEIQRRIFEPFFTTKGIRGTGLGLVVTRRIIEQHKGTITLRSDLTRGSTFSITIPVDPDANIDPSATTARQ
ncbi:MAG: ATP-binding protein [Phycisphaerales bacterium]|nr:ATP-binding protein [Phycisphaerales bacterium]